MEMKMRVPFWFALAMVLIAGHPNGQGIATKISMKLQEGKELHYGNVDAGYLKNGEWLYVMVSGLGSLHVTHDPSLPDTDIVMTVRFPLKGVTASRVPTEMLQGFAFRSGDRVLTAWEITGSEIRVEQQGVQISLSGILRLKRTYMLGRSSSEIANMEPEAVDLSNVLAAGDAAVRTEMFKGYTRYAPRLGEWKAELDRSKEQK